MIYQVSMEELQANSFKDFHVRGFDYLCLKRSEQLTVKVYLFDGDVADAAEVVCPHDHRYDFRTICLGGQVANQLFREDRFDPRAEVFRRFAYRTPLNGGDGFEEVGEGRLVRGALSYYRAGEGYHMPANGIHTIRVDKSRTAIMLLQGPDKVPIGQPTKTFMTGDPPDLSGLYSRFSADELRERLKILKSLVASTLMQVELV